MKHRIVVGLAVVLLLMSSVALGQDNRRTEEFSLPLGQTGQLIGSCGTFDVLNDWTSLYTGTLVYDKSGQFVRQIEHIRLIGESRYYNSTDPAKEVLGGPHEVQNGRLEATGLYYGSGPNFRIRVPGYGLIFAETGRFVFDTNTGQILFNSGHNQYLDQDLAALCNYLK